MPEKPLFKQLKLKEVEPLLIKTRNDKLPTADEKSLIDGTIHGVLHKKINDSHAWHRVLSDAYQDAQIEGKLADAKAVDLKKLQESDWSKVADTLMGVSSLIDLIDARAHGTRTALALQGRPLSDEFERKRYGTHYSRVARAFEGTKDPSIKEFLHFTRADKIKGLEELRAMLDNVLDGKARDANPKVFFPKLARMAEDKPNPIKYSHLIDKFIGIRPHDVEKEIGLRQLNQEERDEEKVYQGTPYSIIHKFFRALKLNDKDVLYDLGSGYGRVPFFAALTTPVKKAIGLELMPERVDHCNEIKKKHDIKNVEFRAGNVLKHDFSDGTVFFLFNPFEYKTLNKVIDKLHALDKDFRIASWGPCNLFFDRLPWLKTEKNIGASDTGDLKIYRRVRK